MTSFHRHFGIIFFSVWPIKLVGARKNACECVCMYVAQNEWRKQERRRTYRPTSIVTWCWHIQMNAKTDDPLIINENRVVVGARANSLSLSRFVYLFFSSLQYGASEGITIRWDAQKHEIEFFFFVLLLQLFLGSSIPFRHHCGLWIVCERIETIINRWHKRKSQREINCIKAYIYS